MMCSMRRWAIAVVLVHLGSLLMITAAGQPRAEAQVQAGRIRLVPDTPASSFRVRARFPAKPEECKPNQPRDLEAAYPGTLEIGRRADGRLFLIGELTFPQYLKGIDEVPRNWPLEALKTQVVAARTYAISHLNPTSQEARELRYDLCSTDACQVYRGLKVERGPWGDMWARAVDETTGQILEFGGKPATTFYFSTSNGETYSNTYAFGGTALPYLKPVKENDDKSSPTSSWTVRMPLTDLAETLRRSKTWGDEPIGSVRKDGDSVVISGGGKSVTLTVDVFRRRLNKDAVCLEPKRYPTPASTGKGNLPQVVPSKWMTLRQEGSDVVMEGRGWGHGVGMVQWGAKGKAERGMRYADILATYYGGLRPVQKAEPDRIRVLLAKDIEELTVEPDGPAHAEGTTLRGGPIVIRGGGGMSVDQGDPIAPVLVLDKVQTNGVAAPGDPASFTFELSAAASVGLRYQSAEDAEATGQQGEKPPEPRERGPGILMWDAGGLPQGAYDVVLVADDGVDQVFSPPQRVTVPGASPSPSPSPAGTPVASRPASGPTGGWQLPAVLGLGVFLAAGGTWFLIRRRAGRHSAP
jgi:stage II sporulation protein D